MDTFKAEYLVSLERIFIAVAIANTVNKQHPVYLAIVCI